MKSSLTLFFLFLTVPLVLAQQAPVAPVRPVVEEYCGEQVTDRYRYMENMDDSEVQQWFRGQADYARSVLDQIPGRDSLEAQLLDVVNREKASVSQVKVTTGTRYFYLKTNQGEDVARLYHRDGYEGEEKLLFDPTAYDSASGKGHVLYFYQPSGDGSKVALSITADGAEVGTLMVIDVASKRLYPDRIEGFWFGELSWLPDNERFFYLMPQRSNPDTAALYNKTLLHQVGTESAKDRVVLSKAHNPGLGIQDIDFPLVYVSSPSPSHLVAELGGVSADRKVFYAPIEQVDQDSIQWKVLADIDDEIGKNAVAIREDEIFALTSRNTERFAVVKTSLSSPNLKQSEVVVPESEEVIKEFVLTSRDLFYSTVANGVEANLYHQPSSTEEAQKVELPLSAGVVDISAMGQGSPDIWLGLGGWITPYTRYQYHASNQQLEERDFSPKAEYPEYEDLVVEELMIPSYDGTKVPLSIIYQKGTPLDGTAPLMMEGYGAYGFSIEPSFAPDLLLWTTQGGIYAVAHVRGGGELGDAWHRGGKKTTKPNTWKDFIACAEYLIGQQYTTSEKLAITGGSAGGILIGRAMTERPNLFATAVPRAASLNIIRLEQMFGGPANTKEFGSIQNHEECRALLEMDAYLHIADSVDYPAALVITGINDPRVNPWIPAKFAARLQAVARSSEPILFRVDYADGHGFASSKSKQAELWTDIYSFALWQTGHPDFQPAASVRQSTEKSSGR